MEMADGDARRRCHERSEWAGSQNGHDGRFACGALAPHPGAKRRGVGQEPGVSPVAWS
jgi:hypothetical protein